MTADTLPARSRERKANREKPAKPRKDFPLFPHASGQWAKCVKRKTYYFGSWDDPDAAERLWDKQKEDIRAGRDPRREHYRQSGATVGDLANAYLDQLDAKLERGELTNRYRNEVLGFVTMVVKHLGKHRSIATLNHFDFVDLRNVIPETWGVARTNGFLGRVCPMFNFAFESGLVETPLNYRLGLKKLSAKAARKENEGKDAKEFSQAETKRLFAAANLNMRAFILLGLNCGYGGADIGRLKISDIDFGAQWLGVRRGKTGVARGCWLWPETVKALRESIAKRPPTVCPEKRSASVPDAPASACVR